MCIESDSHAELVRFDAQRTGPRLVCCPHVIDGREPSDGGRRTMTHVTAIAWSLVGLMAASLGVLTTALFAGLGRVDGQLASLGARIDTQGAYLGSRIDAQGATLGARIEAQGAALSARIDAQGATLG